MCNELQYALVGKSEYLKYIYNDETGLLDGRGTRLYCLIYLDDKTSVYASRTVFRIRLGNAERGVIVQK